MSYYKFSCQPHKSLSLANVCGQPIGGHCFISHTFENNVILPKDYNIISMKQMLDNDILQTNFRVIISPGNGFCLLHSLSLSLKSQFPDSHAISINEVINFFKKEAILHKERYLSAFENNSSNSLLHGLSEYINNRVYDELHFITACAVNVNERRALYDKLTDKFQEFEHLCDLEKFVFLFTFDDAQMLSWLGKFLYKSFRSKSVQTECL